MLQIKISDLDTLNDLSQEMGILVYLQQLVNAEDDSIDDSRLAFGIPDVIEYLSDLQYKAAVQLQMLVTKDDFAMSDQRTGDGTAS